MPPPPHPTSLNGSAETVLIRLDERMKTVVAAVERLERKVEEDLVSKAEFDGVRRIVYGVVAIVLGAFVTALVTGVIPGGAP